MVAKSIQRDKVILLSHFNVCLTLFETFCHQTPPKDEELLKFFEIIPPGVTNNSENKGQQLIFV